MNEWNGPEGWTESEEWKKQNDPPPDKPGSRTVSFVAGLILAMVLVGFGCMAFPYVLAM